MHRDSEGVDITDIHKGSGDEQGSGGRPQRSTDATDTNLPLTMHVKFRSENNSFWSAMATQHGANLSATASTRWVRSASLRRLNQVIKRGDRVLDVGCGNGSSLLGPLSGKCYVYGVDMTEEMLQNAKQHHPKARGLCRSDACYLPFQSASFDVVYSSRCVINVLTEEMQQVALSEIFRVVKPNGTVVLMENFEEPLARMNRAREHYHAGPPIVDAHNLQLNLERTLQYSGGLGWRALKIQSNTWASFVSNVVVPKITRQRGSWLAERILYPFYVFLCWFEDHAPMSVPVFGKDTTVFFRKASG